MNFSVLGTGAWGTAMALHLVRLGHAVSLVPRRFEMAMELGSRRENVDYLKGRPFPESLQVGFELAPILMETEVVILASPVAGVRDWCVRIRESRSGARSLKLILSLAKGLEPGTHRTPSRIVREILPDVAVGALTGPSHAAEVADGRPTALLLAVDPFDEFANEVQAAISGSSLRVYAGDDVPGAELGGGLKNIYAIAAGMSDGLLLGDNAKAALMTRALAEMIRVGVALGARATTFVGLSGYGDLVATCYGSWSRNREFGYLVGQGRSASELLEGRRTIVEGFRTAESVHALCREKRIEAPILEQVHAVLFRGVHPKAGLAALMGRELRHEYDRA